MTQRNVRGAYMNFTHDRQADWDWLAKWQPNVIRLMMQGNHNDPNSVDVNRIRRVHETVPGATILLRVWDVDDRNFEAHADMVANPRAEAERQVDWWAKLFDRVQGVPRNQLMAGLNNETGPEKDAALYVYSESALGFGIQRRVRLGVFVFSVGRPGLAGESEYDIPRFSQLEPLIQANNGAVVLHEYLQPEGMYAVWTDAQGNERKDYTYLIGRNLRWKLSPTTPIIIGEWGIDGILYNRHPDPVYGNSGWRNFKTDWPPNRYADEYVECVRKASDNVIGICPFISDFADRKWQSFDLIDAYGEFIARKDLCVRENTATGDGPTPVTPTAPSYVAAPSEVLPVPMIGTVAAAQLNVRSGPAVSYPVIRQLLQGEIVNITAIVERVPSTEWLQVGVGEWVHGGWVRTQEGVQPTPQQPTGDNWSRAWPIVLKIEGGLSTDRNDKGNYRPDGTFVGTRWGISALSHPTVDIINLTKEDALKIYHQNYWIGGGCENLDWPLCLLHFDAYVQNPNAAKKFLAASGGDPILYMAARIDWYTTTETWDFHGRGWMHRCATMLREVAK